MWWRQDTALTYPLDVVGAPIAGATNAICNCSMCKDNNGNYKVEISNAAGLVREQATFLFLGRFM